MKSHKASKLILSVLALGMLGIPACRTSGTTDTGAKPAAATAQPAPPKPAPDRPGDTRPGATMYLPTGERSTSAMMIEKVYPAEVVAGQTVEYEVRVTNLTGMGLSDVTVTDSAPSNFKVASSNPKAEMAGANMVFRLGDIPARAQRSVNVTGSATGVGQVTNCSSAQWSNSTCMAINVVQPALRVVKTAPADVSICDPIPIKIDVTNTGSGMARNVRVSDALPAGLTTSDGKTELAFDAGNLGAGQTRSFTANLKPTKTGSFVNKASVAAEGGLAAESAPVTTTVRQPVLAITKTGPERVFIGRNATYEITVTNTGDAPAVGTTIEDTISGGSFVSASDGGAHSAGKVTWNLGTLAPKAVKKLTLALSCAGASGAMTNTAMARAACCQSVSATAKTECAGIPALLLDGNDDPDPVQIGETTTYTLVVTNQGSAPLTNIRLVCTMDEGDTMQYVSSTGAGQANVQGRTITFPAIPRLDPKQHSTYKIVIKAVKEAQVSFKAEATSDQITRPLVKSETTNFYK